MAHSIKRSLGFSAALIALWLGLKLILPLILPFVLGAGLALAAEPAAKFLGQRCRLPGFLASALAVSAGIAASSRSTAANVSATKTAEGDVAETAADVTRLARRPVMP